MKKVILLICVLLVHSSQLLAQSYNKETNKISNEIKKGRTNEASKLLSKIPKPALSTKSQRTFIAYYYLKFTLLKNQKFSQIEAQNAFDSLSNIDNKLFKSMPPKGIFKRNTRSKLSKDCPLIDINGKCFKDLKQFYSDAISQFKNELNQITQNQIIRNEIDSIKKKTSAVKDSLLFKKDSLTNEVKKANNEVNQARTILGDTYKKETIKETNKDLKTKKSKAVKDSVCVNFKVSRIDSIELSVYLVSGCPPDSNGACIVNQYGLSEYCNEKVNSTVENGVFNVIKGWISIVKGDTLNISVKIIGEADATWGDTNQLQTFVNDSYGIGDQMGLKTGDKISNDTIAKLRAVAARTFLFSGIKKTESFVKKNSQKNKVVVVNSVMFSKDWLKDKAKDEKKGPQFRKEILILKCNNCK